MTPFTWWPALLRPGRSLLFVAPLDECGAPVLDRTVAVVVRNFTPDF